MTIQWSDGNLPACWPLQAANTRVEMSVFRTGITWADGNEKLGKKVMVIDRPVGLTCPSSCQFLTTPDGKPGECYALATEGRFPQSRVVGMENLTASAERIRHALDVAAKKGINKVRINSRGDMGLNDKVDATYVAAWKKALKGVKGMSTWLYSHFYDRRIANLPNVSAYASVHNKQDYEKAKKAGFKLFAFILPDHKKKGGSKDYPKYVEGIDGKRTLVCPENRLGRQRVTCASCKWCVEGKGNVCFLVH